MGKRAARKLAATVCALVCVLALFVQAGSLPVHAKTELEEKREEYNRKKEEAAQLETAIKALNASIESGRASAEEQQQLMEANRQHIALLQEQIDLKLEEIAIQEGIVDAKQAEIVQKQREYDDGYQLLCERLVAMYKMNNASVLSTLLMVDSYSEFLDVANTLRLVSEHDTEMLDELEAQRLALEAEKRELDAMLAELEAARDDLAADMQALEDANAALNWQIDQTYAQIAAEEQELERLAVERAAMEEELEAMWRDLAASQGAYVGGYLEWPVPGYNGDGYISSHFGNRYLYGRPNFHTGMDVNKGSQSSIYGAGIVAANDGTVILVSTSSPSTGYGNYLIIDHGGGVRTLYAHCDSILVSQGAAVRRGDTIALVGNTGNSTGPHLHFELRINNTEKVNPYPYLTGQKSL